MPKFDFDEKKILSSTGALSLKSVPKKMLVIGGGYIGLEMGSVWSRLGSEVHVVEFLDHITPGMDREISKEFLKILKKQGINFKLDCKVTNVSTVKSKSIVDFTDNKTKKKDSLWKGECFVFDNRVSLKHKLKQGTFSICGGCRKPISTKDKKSKKYEEGVSCERCYDTLTNLQKSRFRMRQNQINLAKKVGKKHKFQKEF